MRCYFFLEKIPITLFAYRDLVLSRFRDCHSHIVQTDDHGPAPQSNATPALHPTSQWHRARDEPSCALLSEGLGRLGGTLVVGAWWSGRGVWIGLTD